jgi:hypothetical protein
MGMRKIWLSKGKEDGLGDSSSWLSMDDEITMMIRSIAEIVQ